MDGDGNVQRAHHRSPGTRRPGVIRSSTVGTRVSHGQLLITLITSSGSTWLQSNCYLVRHCNCFCGTVAAARDSCSRPTWFDALETFYSLHGDRKLPNKNSGNCWVGEKKQTVPLTLEPIYFWVPVYLMCSTGTWFEN